MGALAVAAARTRKCAPVLLALSALLCVVTPQEPEECFGLSGQVREGYDLPNGEKVDFDLSGGGGGSSEEVHQDLYVGFCGNHSCSVANLVYSVRPGGSSVSRSSAYHRIATTTNQILGPGRHWPRVTLSGTASGSLYVRRRSDSEFSVGFADIWEFTVPVEPHERLLRAVSLHSTLAADFGEKPDLPPGAEVRLLVVPVQEQGYANIAICRYEWWCDVLQVYGKGSAGLQYRLLNTTTNQPVQSGLTTNQRTDRHGFRIGDNFILNIKRRASGDAVDVQLEGSDFKGVTINTLNYILKTASNMSSVYILNGYSDKIKHRYGTACGKSTELPSGLVANGVATPIDSVPWHSGIYHKINGEWTNVCGGSLISPSVVLTAAHCLVLAKGLIDRELVSVAVGKTLSDWNADEGPDVHRARAEALHVHPRYRGVTGSKLSNDIGVVVMDSCAAISDSVFPICIGESVQPISGEKLIVPGWGGGDNPVKRELEAVALITMSNQECFEAMSSNPKQISYVTRDKFCTPRADVLQRNNSAHIEVAERVKIKMEAEIQEPFHIAICGEGCTVFKLFAAQRTSFGYEAIWTNGLIVTKESTLVSSPETTNLGVASFTFGEQLKFSLEMRSGEAALWLDKAPSEVAVVPLSCEQCRLVLETNVGTANADLQGNGGKVLKAGDRTRVQLTVSPKNRDDRDYYKAGSLRIGLCGQTDCSVFQVTGSRGEPASSFIFNSYLAGNPDDISSKQHYVGTPGIDTLTLKRPFEFVVERRPKEMAVWLDGYPREAAIIPLRKGHDKLNVVFYNGIWQFVAAPKADGAMGLLKGDSGGGAAVRRGGHWFLQGVVSVSLESPELGQLFAYTDVSQFSDWLARFTTWASQWSPAP